MSDHFSQFGDGQASGGTGRRPSSAKASRVPHATGKPRGTHPLVFGGSSEPAAANSSPSRSRARFPKGARPSAPPKYISEHRAQMAGSGVLIASFLLERESRSLLQAVRLESRGYLLPQEVRSGHAALQKAARSSYETTLKDIPDIEEKDLLRVVKQDIERAAEQALGKIPLIIPIFHSL